MLQSSFTCLKLLHASALLQSCRELTRRFSSSLLSSSSAGTTMSAYASGWGSGSWDSRCDSLQCTHLHHTLPCPCLAAGALLVTASRCDMTDGKSIRSAGDASRSVQAAGNAGALTHSWMQSLRGHFREAPLSCPLAGVLLQVLLLLPAQAEPLQLVSPAQGLQAARSALKAQELAGLAARHWLLQQELLATDWALLVACRQGALLPVWEPVRRLRRLLAVKLPSAAGQVLLHALQLLVPMAVLWLAECRLQLEVTQQREQLLLQVAGWQAQGVQRERLLQLVTWRWACSTQTVILFRAVAAA